MGINKRKSRARVVDPILGTRALAAVLDCSQRTASRRLAACAISRSGLWPQQLDESGRIVVRASVVNAYLDSLPCLEDVEDRRLICPAAL